MRLILFVIFISFAVSCSLFKKKGTWGKNALYPIPVRNIVYAIKNNASSPHVWGPLIGAGVFAGLNLDENFSNWAHREVLFKNSESAREWSNRFNKVLQYEMYSIILLTPSYDEHKSFGHYVLSKTRGGLVVNLAGASSRYASDQLKNRVHRERPNKADYRSFPSGHATVAGGRRAIISKGIEVIEMNSHLRLGINVFNTTLSMGSMWARVQAKAHYASDVLAGYAFGSFVSGVVYDFLINHDPNETIVLMPFGDKVSANYIYQF